MINLDLMSVQNDKSELEKYWDQLKSEYLMDEFDSVEAFTLIDDIDSSFRELDQHLLAYENLCTINTHIAKYGKSDALLDLVGEEGLLASAGNALQSIGKFIVKVFKHIVTAIISFIHSVAITFTFPVGQAMLNRKLTIHWDMDEVYGAGVQCVSAAVGSLYVLDQAKEAADTKAREQLKERSNKLINATKEKQQSFDTTYRAFRDKCSSIFELNNKATHKLDNLQHAIDKFTSIAPEKFTTDTLVKIYTTLDAYGCTSHAKMAFTNRTDDVSKLTEFVRLHVKVCSLYVKHLMETSTTIVNFIKKAHKLFTDGKVQIHEEFTFPKEICEHLSQFYKQPVDIKKLVITNLTPDDWDTVGNPNILGGWCLAETKAHDTTIFVTYNSFMKFMKRVSFGRGWSPIDHHGLSLTKEDSMIRTIVHEAKHLCDQQNGRDMSKPANYNNPKVYRNVEFEKDARKAQRDYEPSASVKTWARSIIERLKKAAEESSKKDDSSSKKD